MAVYTCLLRICRLADVSLLVLRSLLSNGPTRYNIVKKGRDLEKTREILPEAEMKKGWP
jgi:hypothetical protein